MPAVQTITQGRLGARLRVDDSGPKPTVAGTEYEDGELREALRTNGFRWRKPRQVWEYAGPQVARDAALTAVRDTIADLDRRQASEQSAKPSFPPTPQQAKIIDACVAGRDVAVQALAGTGKTSTLRLVAAAMPDRRITYVAFNASIAAEARGAFDRNVTAATAHSLAKRALRDGPYAGKLDRVGMGARWPDDVAAVLGITPVTYRSTSGARQTMDPAAVARLAMAAVRTFRESADPELGRRHLPGIAAENTDLRQMVLTYARQAWDNIRDPANAGLLSRDPPAAIVFDHDDYLKIWALSNPRLDCDLVFFDEAQDINDVLRKLVQDQPMQTVVVGDTHQSIYGFRGAKDALADWPADVVLPLTQSWRFGPDVAQIGNEFLTLLGSDLVLEGNPAFGTGIGRVDNPDAILCRTNAGAVSAVFAAVEQGKRVALVGGGGAIRDIAKAARDLQRGRATKHPDLSKFGDWDEVVDFANADPDAKTLQTFVRLVNQHSPDGLIRMVGDLVPEDAKGSDRPDLVVSTAHKAKGREWGQVRIADDFRKPTVDPETGQPILPAPEELRLSYVTITRVQGPAGRIELGSLEWITDYTAAGVPAPAVTTATLEEAQAEEAQAEEAQAEPAAELEDRIPDVLLWPADEAEFEAALLGDDLAQAAASVLEPAATVPDTGLFDTTTSPAETVPSADPNAAQTIEDPTAMTTTDDPSPSVNEDPDDVADLIAHDFAVGIPDMTPVEIATEPTPSGPGARTPAASAGLEPDPTLDQAWADVLAVFQEATVTEPGDDPDPAPQYAFADLNARFAALRRELGMDPGTATLALAGLPPDQGLPPGVELTPLQDALDGAAQGGPFHDIPEWRRIQGVFTAARDLMNAVADAGRGYGTELSSDVRIRGFGATVAARVSRLVSTAAYTLAGRLERGGHRATTAWRAMWRLHRRASDYADRLMGYLPADRTLDRVSGLRDSLRDLEERLTAQPAEPALRATVTPGLGNGIDVLTRTAAAAARDDRITADPMWQRVNDLWEQARPVLSHAHQTQMHVGTDAQTRGLFQAVWARTCEIVSHGARDMMNRLEAAGDRDTVSWNTLQMLRHSAEEAIGHLRGALPPSEQLPLGRYDPPPAQDPPRAGQSPDHGLHAVPDLPGPPAPSGHHRTAATDPEAAAAAAAAAKAFPRTPKQRLRQPAATASTKSQAPTPSRSQRPAAHADQER